MSDYVNYSLDLPEALKARAERLAAQDGISLDEWITQAIVQKTDTLEFFRSRAEGADAEGLLNALRNAPDIEPESWDRLPQDRNAS